MPAPHSVQPPEVVAVVGSRYAASYSLCECGEVKARKAKVCRECYETENA